MGAVLLWTGPGLTGQDLSWEAYRATWRRGSHLPVTLLAPKAWVDPRAWATDEALLQLIAGGDLSLQPLEGRDLDGIRAARGWDAAPHWLALDQDGDVLDETTAAPDGARVKAWLLGTGRSASWDEQERFLRLHPDQGTALALRLARSMRMARIRFRALEQAGAVEGVRLAPVSRWPQLTPARILDPVKAEGWDREVADTLRRISQLPDAWRLGNDLLLRYWLEFFCSAASPDLQEGLPAFREALLAAWQRYPDSGGQEVLDAPTAMAMDGVGGLWMACCRCMPGQADHLPEVPDLETGPGQVWPDSTLLRDLGLAAGATGQWADLLRALDRWPGPDPAAAPSPQSWADALAVRRQAAFWRLAALAALDRWPEAAAALQNLRAWAGPDWVRVRTSLKAFYDPSPKAGEARAGARLDPVPSAFLSLLELPAMPEPKPPPSAPPLRFVVWGAPAWIKDWPTIRVTGGLAAYAPEELRREEPTPADQDRLAAAGLPAQGWAVLRGPGDVLARGEGAPDPARLALQLEGAAPSRIAVLDAFIRQHPEQLDARKERYGLVRERMPLPALEPRMREDAVAAQLPLDFGPDAPWISDLEGWRAAARRVVPELQAALERWPDRSYLWRAWVSWSAFLPQPPSVLDFAQGLPVLGPRPPWAAALPAEVQRAIARQGMASRRFQDLLDWFGEAWAVVRARTWEGGISRPARDQERAIYEGYRDALRASGLAGDLPSLEQAWNRQVSRHGKAGAR